MTLDEMYHWESESTWEQQLLTMGCTNQEIENQLYYELVHIPELKQEFDEHDVLEFLGLTKEELDEYERLHYDLEPLINSARFDDLPF